MTRVFIVMLKFLKLHFDVPVQRVSGPQHRGLCAISLPKAGAEPLNKANSL